MACFVFTQEFYPLRAYLGMMGSIILVGAARVRDGSLPLCLCQGKRSKSCEFREPKKETTTPKVVKSKPTLDKGERKTSSKKDAKH